MWLIEILLVFYIVTKEKAAINYRKTVYPIECILLLVFVASKSSLLVEQFQMEYDQLLEKFLRPPRIIPPLEYAPMQKSKKWVSPQGALGGIVAFPILNLLPFCHEDY